MFDSPGLHIQLCHRLCITHTDSVIVLANLSGKTSHRQGLGWNPIGDLWLAGKQENRTLWNKFINNVLFVG